MRLITWNINRARPGGEEFCKVAEHLRGVQPEVVALQLASREFTLALAKDLGWPTSGVRHCCAGGSDLYGNAVLSVCRVLSSEAHDLPSPPGFHPRRLLCVQLQLRASKSTGGAQRVDNPSVIGAGEEGEERSAPGTLTVCSAHLENTSEEVRMGQAQAMVAFLASLGRPHVLCGDLNALLVSDFPEGKWDELCEIAETSGWESREERVMRFLLDMQGYSDAMPAPAGTGREAHGGVQRFTFFLPPASMWVRIDYVLLSRGFPGSAVHCWCEEVRGASNHHPVFAEITHKSGSRSSSSS